METKGGVALSQENQSSLRFSLEESLWFRKGQEVEELVSISLDPDITIQENDQYVTIRGSLELTGEYKSFDESNASGDENFSVPKYVQSIEERENGFCHFSHRFPVDITIPNNRIQSIYDIDVMVESFDYTLPERSCIKLSAELTISGLYGEKQNESIEETQNFEILYRSNGEQAEEKTSEELLFQEDPDEYTKLFEVEARKEQEEESYANPIHYPTFSYQVGTDDFNHQEAIHQRKEYVQPVEFITEKEPIQEKEHLEKITEEETAVEESSPVLEDESPPKQDFKKKILEKLSKKKTMSLTDFLARKEEGGKEEQAKLKVCIVQKGDTLDRLAERYDVTLQSLLRVNHLEINQDVLEGQVLYIPAAFAKK